MGCERKKTWGVRSKVWLEVEGKPIMGEGRNTILEAIDQYGSIIHASRATGISYRRIRGAIRDMERAVGGPLVRSFRGGDQGGGASLTTAAYELMDSFKKISAGMKQEMDSRFQTFFKK